METKGGKPLPRRFPSLKVPTLWFLDGNQNDLGQIQGANSPEETAEKLQEMLALHRERRDRLVWTTNFVGGFNTAKDLARPYMTVAWYPVVAGRPTDAEVFKDPEVVKKSRQLVCVDLECEQDLKQARWLGQESGIRIWFLNPFDDERVSIDGIPDKAALLAAMDGALKRFDEWFEKWKAGRKK